MVKITKEIRQEIKEKVKKYYLEGYYPGEIVKLLDEELIKYYDGDEDKLYGTVSTTIKNLDPLSEEEKENRKEFRRKRILEQQKKYADRFVELIELDFRSTGKYQVWKVAERLSQEIGYSDKAILVASLQFYHKDLYEKYTMPKIYTEEELEEIAYKVINNDLHLSTARFIEGYNKMIEYVKEKRPDLYEQICAVYASHQKRIQMEHKIFNWKNSEILIKIICEFRVPFEVMVSFINVHRDMFLSNTNKLLSVEEFVSALQKDYSSKETCWYLNEMSLADEFTDYRVNRFNIFAAKFAQLKESDEKLAKLINVETRDRYGIIERKINLHKTGEFFNFTEDEARIIVNHFYKNGLALIKDTREKISTGVNFRSLEEKLKNTNNFEDIILLSGIEKLREYNNNFSFNPKAGSKF